MPSSLDAIFRAGVCAYTELGTCDLGLKGREVR
jgi:hypothetical protein